MKPLIYSFLFVLMIATAMAVECDFGQSVVTNCDLTSNVTITGTHYVANVSVYSDVYVNMDNALILWDDSWGYKLHSEGTNLFFGVRGDDVVFDGNSNSIIRGNHGHTGSWACDGSYGTTAIEMQGAYDSPEITNLRFERHLAPIKYYWATEEGLIIDNVIDVKNDAGEGPCHPAIYGTGNYTLISGNEINGDITIFGGTVDIIDNSDTSIDENCEFPHFTIRNDVQHEGIHKYWYGGQITGNTFHNCQNGFQTVDYTGDGYNISNNENIQVEINGEADGNEYLYDNTGLNFISRSTSGGLPTLCVDGVGNTFRGISITQPGTWSPDMFYCPGITEVMDVGFDIKGNDITFDCNGIPINDMENCCNTPVTIFADSAISNIIVQNCDLGNSFGSGMSIAIFNGEQISDITLRNLDIISTGDSIFGFGVNGLTIDNVTGTDCGGGINFNNGGDWGQDNTNNNILIENSHFENGGCKGYNSLFQVIDGLTITGTTFDTSGSLAWNQESLSFDPSVTNLDFHDNHVIGDAYIAMDASSGMVYSNVLDTPLIWLNPEIDICHSGDSNTYNHNLGFLVGEEGWYEPRYFELDPACNPLIFNSNASEYSSGLTLGTNVHLNGNGVDIRGPFRPGINGITTFMKDFSTAKNSVVENLNLYGYAISIHALVFSQNNTFKDMIVDYPYVDEGVGNTFQNITILHPRESGGGGAGHQMIINPTSSVYNTLQNKQKASFNVGGTEITLPETLSNFFQDKARVAVLIMGVAAVLIIYNGQKGSRRKRK